MIVGLALLLGTLGSSATAQANTADGSVDSSNVKTAWRLLDYVAVDYGGAVSDGKMKNAAEYAEMTEFVTSVSDRLGSLPPTPARGGLIAGAAQLKAVVAGKRPAERVAKLANGLAADLLKAYPVPLAPAKAPDLARAATLFTDNCASCHGAPRGMAAVRAQRSWRRHRSRLRTLSARGSEASLPSTRSLVRVSTAPPCRSCWLEKALPPCKRPA